MAKKLRVRIMERESDAPSDIEMVSPIYTETTLPESKDSSQLVTPPSAVVPEGMTASEYAEKILKDAKATVKSLRSRVKAERKEAYQETYVELFKAFIESLSQKVGKNVTYFSVTYKKGEITRFAPVRLEKRVSPD